MCLNYIFPRNHTLVNHQVDDNGFVLFSYALSHNVVEADENVNLNRNHDKIEFSEVLMISFLVGKSLPHQFMCACMFKRCEWLCNITYHVEGLFVFTFDCENSKNEALFMGYIISSDSAMIFNPW